MRNRIELGDAISVEKANSAPPSDLTDYDLTVAQRDTFGKWTLYVKGHKEDPADVVALRLVSVDVAQKVCAFEVYVAGGLVAAVPAPDYSVNAPIPADQYATGTNLGIDVAGMTNNGGSRKLKVTRIYVTT